MPRIRTVKPDYWQHPGVTALSFGARLLYIASWNFADDEGLLRWTPTLVKASAFPSDDTLDVRPLMAELEDAHYVHPYEAGTSQQRLGWVVNFRTHQKINRPQPSRLPAPDLTDPAVAARYGERDEWTCHLCRDHIDGLPGLALHLRTDRAHGGTTHPSNIVCLHAECQPHDRDSLNDSLNDTVNGSVNLAVSYSLNDSLNHAMPTGDTPQLDRSRARSVNGALSDTRTDREGEGDREEEGEGEGPRASAPPRPPRCVRHENLHPDDPGPPCVGCRSVRQRHERELDERKAAQARDAREARIAAQVARRGDSGPVASPSTRQAAREAYSAARARVAGGA